MVEEWQRQRAERVDVKQSRQALKLVVPINRRIGPWQTRAARLAAFGEKLRSTGGFEPRLLAEAEELSAAVEEERLALRAQAQHLPPEISGHSRLLDTARALETVSVGVARALSLLRPRGDARV